MAHRHPYRDDAGCIEVGPTVCLRPTVHGGNPDVTESATGAIAGGELEHLYGFIVAYDWPDSDVRLEGAVCVDPHGAPGAMWTMTGSLEGGDLTLAPSIQAFDSRDRTARTKTIHGWVRNGAWVPA